jgi:hypothetical protein
MYQPMVYTYLSQDHLKYLETLQFAVRIQSVSMNFAYVCILIFSLRYPKSPTTFDDITSPDDSHIGTVINVIFVVVSPNLFGFQHYYRISFRLFTAVSRFFTWLPTFLPPDKICPFVKNLESNIVDITDFLGVLKIAKKIKVGKHLYLGLTKIVKKVGK